MGESRKQCIVGGVVTAVNSSASSRRDGVRWLRQSPAEGCLAATFCVHETGGRVVGENMTFN